MIMWSRQQAEPLVFGLRGGHCRYKCVVGWGRVSGPERT